MRLVADIGGTNSRLAVADSDGLRANSVRSYRNAAFPSFLAVVQTFLSEASPQNLAEVALAVAGPVDGGTARLTNRGWDISATELAAHIGAGRAAIINDLVALGYAVPWLGRDELDMIVGGEPEPVTPHQSLIVGIGTGFNVSAVVQTEDNVVCLRSEFGHIGLPAGVARALDARLDGLSMHFPTVEHCFSGRGFAEVCRLLTDREGLGPEEFFAIYRQGGSPDVIEAVDCYAELVGWLLRELMLAFLPTSGVYFAGSVARSILTAPSRSGFQDIVSRPYQIEFHERTPVHVISSDTAALNGCARVPCVSV